MYSLNFLEFQTFDGGQQDVVHDGIEAHRGCRLCNRCRRGDEFRLPSF